MSERKPISKKLRFEVFKRDSFKCQYCGQEAPKVVLNCDHIHPVAEGGDNDISNLITACWDCNSGKGARTLDDDAVVIKQKQQLNELNERRIQLEMVADWRTGLKDLETETVDTLDEYWGNLTGYTWNEIGRRDATKWISKYSLQEIYEAMDASANQYLKSNEDGDGFTHESVNKCMNYIPRILSVKKRSKDKPYLQDLYYIRGILKNRGLHINHRTLMPLMERACEVSGDSEDLVPAMKQVACEVRNWTSFRLALENFIERMEKINGEN